MQKSELLHQNRNHCTAFAILTRSREQLARIINALERETDNMGPEINEDRTKFIVWGHQQPEHALLVFGRDAGQMDFRNVEEMTYLVNLSHVTRVCQTK